MTKIRYIDVKKLNYSVIRNYCSFVFQFWPLNEIVDEDSWWFRNHGHFFGAVYVNFERVTQTLFLVRYSRYLQWVYFNTCWNSIWGMLVITPTDILRFWKLKVNLQPIIILTFTSFKGHILVSTLFCVVNSDYYVWLTWEKSGSQINGDGREPNHRRTEEDALRRVHEQGSWVLHLILVVFGDDWGVVEHGGQHVDRCDGDEQQKSCLDQRALVHGLTTQNGQPQGYEKCRSGAVHSRLMKQESLRPSEEKNVSHRNKTVFKSCM